MNMKELIEENKCLKVQLQEQIDYKYEYYYYWQEASKQLALIKKILRSLYEK